MSTLFKSPPSTFAQYESLRFPQRNAFTAQPEAKRPEQNRRASSVLRDDHIVLAAIDVLLALHAAVKKWRQRKRTLRALADLDERQLRDIGLTRDQTHYHALRELDNARTERSNGKV